MIQTVHIIEELISEMKVELNVSKVDILLNDEYKLYVCNTQYLNSEYVFTIGGEKATVLDFSCNEYVIIKVLNFTPIKGKYLLPNPFYFFGTVIEVNDERDEIPYQEGKYPYVFLLERMTEQFNNNTESMTDRVSPLKLFFLTNYKLGEWKTKQHYKEIIEPMTNLREMFVNLLIKSKLVNDEETFNENWVGTNYVKFGTYSELNGNIKSVFDEDVSGVSLEINVVFFKSLNCKNNECM